MEQRTAFENLTLLIFLFSCELHRGAEYGSHLMKNGYQLFIFKHMSCYFQKILQVNATVVKIKLARHASTLVAAVNQWLI